MRKISDAVREIVDHDPTLRLGLARGLMNLTQVARHIHTAVEVRTQKPAKVPAIAMALSRLRDELPDLDEGPELRLADRVTVQRGLAVLSFPNTHRSQRGLLELQEAIGRARRFLTITEGMREITVILEERWVRVAEDTVGEPASRRVGNVASLSIALTDRHLEIPGVLYQLLQPLALQGLSLAEVASTTKEFHVYLDADDVMLALESLHGAFGGR